MPRLDHLVFRRIAVLPVPRARSAWRGRRAVRLRAETDECHNHIGSSTEKRPVRTVCDPFSHCSSAFAVQLPAPTAHVFFAFPLFLLGMVLLSGIFTLGTTFRESNWTYVFIAIIPTVLKTNIIMIGIQTESSIGNLSVFPKAAEKSFK